jgi:hypothetical protein
LFSSKGFDFGRPFVANNNYRKPFIETIVVGCCCQSGVGTKDRAASYHRPVKQLALARQVLVLFKRVCGLIASNNFDPAPQSKQAIIGVYPRKKKR